jgi:hypothetical protein
MLEGDWSTRSGNVERSSSRGDYCHTNTQHRSRKAQMNNSVYQARWLLGSVFLLSFGVLAVGFVS